MSGSIGLPLDRAEGILKVTGGARYAADFHPDNLAYGVPIPSPVARGSIERIESAEAEKIPGVLLLLTSQNARKLFPTTNDFGSATKLGETRLALQDEKIHYAGQFVGLLVAETPEVAEEAARRVKVICREEPPFAQVGQALSNAYSPESFFGVPLPVRRGDFEKAFSDAPIKLDAVFTTPVEHHNPMEPHASVADWDGENLTLYESTQWVVGARNVAADALGLPREKVRIISRFVGGGFGCKGFVWPHTLLAAMASLHLKRPIKVALTRPNMFSTVGHRPSTRQELRLGATGDGKIIAIRHHTLTHTSFLDDYLEPCGGPSQSIYDVRNLFISYSVVKLNRGTPTFMRAPGEAPGLFAIESLLDELSYHLKIDPIELRLRNLPSTSPESNLPWSTYHLRECYEIGSERFEWKKRNPRISSMTRGEFTVGWGMATAMFPCYRSPGAARVRILPDGSAEVVSATQDMGTGTYTTMRQIVADVTGIPPEKVVSRLGDSSFPPAPVSGGSMTSASVGPAVEGAARKALEALLLLATRDAASPLRGISPSELHLENGRIFQKSSPRKGEKIEELLKRNDLTHVEGESYAKPDQDEAHFAFQSHGAQFAEVLVNPYTGEVRVSRMVGVFDVGRILNHKTAQSQAKGGMIMGIGMALHEKTAYDPRTARVVTDNLADYLVPVMADAPSIEVEFVDDPDFRFNSLGVRGLGEIGITGVAPAITNAVYHATGIRVRDLPITPEKLFNQD